MCSWSMTRSGRRKRCTETRRRSLASEAELLERATTLAERYGMALVAISRVLDESQSSDARKVWRGGAGGGGGGAAGGPRRGGGGGNKGAKGNQSGGGWGGG